MVSIINWRWFVAYFIIQFLNHGSLWDTWDGKLRVTAVYPMLQFCWMMPVCGIKSNEVLWTHGSSLSLTIMREVRSGNRLLHICPGAQLSTSGAMVHTISWYCWVLKLSGAMSAFTPTLLRQYCSSGIWYAGLIFTCQASNRMGTVTITVYNVKYFPPSSAYS